MEKTIVPGMKNEEVIELMVIQRVDECFAQMRAELLNQRDSRSGETSDGWHDFNKVERYLDSLIRVSAVNGHKVHDEINDAVKKLKEMAYQG